MQHTFTFYPIGNADTTLILLSGKQEILFDYANMKCAGDADDKRIDLPSELNKVVKGEFDVVCFTHADRDHICGFSEYFYLEHAAKYQGKDRKKITELWVPAAVLLETVVDDEAQILRAEARYRLRNKKGIRVFSRPKKLKDWCDSQEDICYEDIKHLLVNAGELAPGFSLTDQGVEFFVHSPFASESQQIDRNNEAIVVQATFNDACSTKVILGSDMTSGVWDDIVKITRHFRNEVRLEWDIFHISHHCSYLSLSNEKGKTITVPTSNIKWMFETQGHDRGRIISPSKSIPEVDTDQPPHRQAAAYYRAVAEQKEGEFRVTMDYPNRENPKPMIFEIDSFACARLKISAAAASSFVHEQKPSRAGNGK